MKTLRLSASILKMILGALFVVSAVSKFVTIDQFEIYVYSFGFVGLTAAGYLARLLIASELILGAALISNRHHRFTLSMSILFLICCIFFLAYAQLIGRTDSCHCFGELLPFNPTQSLLKNAILIALFLFVLKYAYTDWTPRWWLVLVVYVLIASIAEVYVIHTFRWISLLMLPVLGVTAAVGILASFPFYKKWYVTTLLVLAPIVTVFIVSPLDSWFFKNNHEPFNKELFYKTIHSNNPLSDSSQVQLLSDSLSDIEADSISAALSDLNLDSDRHLVAFFSSTCSFCRLAASKISTIRSRFDIDSSRIVYIFPEGLKADSYDDFYLSSLSDHFTERRIDKNLFVQITYGSFPLILLVENDSVVSSYGYRNMNESEIANFLSK